jgi:hypothetical protein
MLSKAVDDKDKAVVEKERWTSTSASVDSYDLDLLISMLTLISYFCFDCISLAK